MNQTVIKHPLHLMKQKLQNLGIDLETSEPATLPDQNSSPGKVQAPSQPVPVSFTAMNIFPPPGTVDWPSMTEDSPDITRMQDFSYDAASFDFTPDMLRAFSDLETMPSAEF
jgi:hypothetical protein